MKKISILLLLCAIVAGCSVGTYYPFAQNHFGAESKVILDKANFRVVRDVEAIVAVNNTRLSRNDLTNSAYGELLRKAQLTGSQVLINVVVEEVRQESGGFFRVLLGIPERIQYVAARATIIEFLDDNGNPIPSVASKNNSTDPDNTENITNTTTTNQTNSEKEVDSDTILNRLRTLGWQNSVLGVAYRSALEQIVWIADEAHANNYLATINTLVEKVFSNKISKDSIEKKIAAAKNKSQKEEYRILLDIAKEF